MEELLQEPRSIPAGQAEPGGPLRGGLHRFAEAAADYGALLRRQGARVYHRVGSRRAGKPAVGRLTFLAAAAITGVVGVTAILYTPSYVVTVDGARVGTVATHEVFQQAERRVASRASAILGYDYTLDCSPSYTFTFTKRDRLTSAADLEGWMFSQIGEITKCYTLTVDGKLIGAAQDRAALSGVLDAISAPYVTGNTTSVTYDKNVHITYEYTASSTLQDIGQMETLLKANTNGQTTYEVQDGDTFMALAFRNNMTMAEMQALNPGVDVNRLYIGQILNVKQVMPFLSVKTADSLTYHQAIDPSVREVDDGSMYEGQTKVLSAGTAGDSVVTANVTRVNGVEEGRDIISTSVLSQPTDKVVAVGTKARPSWLPTGSFIWPVYGHITSGFGYRYIFGSYSFHSGVDIATSYGTAIRAADGGTVVFSGYKGSYGNLVIIDHGNGKQSYYGHCSKLLVSVGDKVCQGQTIARVGSTGRSTGSHCHFEVRINNTSVNPLSYLS